MSLRYFKARYMIIETTRLCLEFKGTISEIKSVICDAEGLGFIRCVRSATEGAGNELAKERIGCSGVKYAESSSAPKLKSSPSLASPSTLSPTELALVDFSRSDHSFNVSGPISCRKPQVD